MFCSRRARTALASLASLVMVGFGGQALPVGAESAKGAQTYQFALSTDDDVTNFLKKCPPHSPYTFLCGTATDVPLLASNSGDDEALSATITESYFNALDFPRPTPTCPAVLPFAPGALLDFSSVTLKTTRGHIFVVTHGGTFCTSTNTDVEPFNIVGGTGKYHRARGFGTIVAHATKPQTATQGFASEVFTGTITVGE